VTVSHYAQIVRDARQTAIFAADPERWVVVNAGRSQTLRLPAARAVRLDLARSPGITGWKIEGDQAYLHTDGSPTVTIALAPQVLARQPRLESTSGALAWHRRQPAAWTFTVDASRPVELMLAGCDPRQPVRVALGGEFRTLAADATGRLPLSAPAGAEVIVEFLPP
jgi:hypothetical protein